MLQAKGLVGGFLHREYVTHDARLVIETILAARERGAVTANYARCQGVLTEGGSAVGVTARDMVSEDEFHVRSRVVVNATGPWQPPAAGSQEAGPDMSLTKGVHALLSRDRLPLRQAVAFFSPRDGRPVFAVPQNGFVYIGTTETAYDGDPASVAVAATDIDYLVEAAAGAFPGRRIEASDVVASWAGVRPLAPANRRDADRASRRYVLRWDSQGVLSILGGKLTLHRRVARAALAAVARRQGWRLPQTVAAPEDNMLPGAVWPTPRPNVASALAQRGLGADAARHLMDTYGGRSRLFVPLLDERPDLAKPISDAAPHTWVEVAFAMEREMAVKPEDFTRRRTDLELSLAAAGASMPSFSHDGRCPVASDAVPTPRSRGAAVEQRSAT